MSAARSAMTAMLVACAWLGASEVRAAAREPRLAANWEAPAPMDVAMPLALGPGQELVIRGAWRTSFDGTVFDAATRTDEIAGTKVVRADGFYDAAGGGLALVASDPEAHVASFVATGDDAPACRALGIAPPCLVPRIAELAHERLLSVDDFAKTLTGEMQWSTPAPIAPPLPPRAVKAASAFAIAVGLLIAGAIAVAIRSARRRTPLGRVRIAAAEARAATRGDAMLAPVAAQIGALVRRATQLDTSRRACAGRLAKIDRPALARRRAEWAVSTAPEASEALAWVHAECAEAARLEADFAASLAGLERIASALRVITLRARSHRGVRVRVGTTRSADPVDTVATELALRDEAIAETERLS